MHSRLAIVEFLTLTLSLDMTGLGRYFLNWFNQIPDMHFLWTSGTISTDNLRPRCCFSSLFSSSSTSPPLRGSPMPRSSPSRTMSRISAGEGCPLICIVSKCGANLDSTLLQNMFPVWAVHKLHLSTIVHRPATEYFRLTTVGDCRDVVRCDRWAVFCDYIYRNM